MNRQHLRRPRSSNSTRSDNNNNSHNNTIDTIDDRDQLETLRRTQHVSVLEARRDAKRRQMEALYAEQHAIKLQIQSLTTELQQLDDQIDQEEIILKRNATATLDGDRTREVHFDETYNNDDDDGRSTQGRKKSVSHNSRRVSYEKDERSQPLLEPQQPQPQQERLQGSTSDAASTIIEESTTTTPPTEQISNTDESQSQPMTFTMNPDEHLTDPTTQQTQHPRKDNGDPKYNNNNNSNNNNDNDDDEARHIADFYHDNEVEEEEPEYDMAEPPDYHQYDNIVDDNIGNDSSAHHQSSRPQSRSNSRIGIGQLQITASIPPQRRTNTTTSGTVHRTSLPAAFQSSTAASSTSAPVSSTEMRGGSGRTTLDQYFGPNNNNNGNNNFVTPATASRTGAHDNNHQQITDALQSLPSQSQLGANGGRGGAYTVAQIPTHEDRNHDYMEQLKSDNFPWSEPVHEALRNVFSIQNFRGHQKEIINCTLNGDDAFVIMRTGGGKSLTYQLPALLEGCSPEKKITLVVSPLLSLIRDQEDQMNAFSPGSATSFTSNLPGGNAEHTRRWNLVRDRLSGVCLIFVTPEKVYKSGRLKSELQKLDNQGRLGRFVIDECHCACQWGHDFRPDYTKLGVLKTLFPRVPLMAVTATASDQVRDDVVQILRLGRNYQFFRSTANRPNLTYSIRHKVDGKDKVVDEIADFIHEKHPRNAGIIYTFSRKEADDVADKLCDRGIVARSYHSSVSESAKDHVHKSWMRNETQVVVATIAFGLGINKPDVRFVLHHSLSKSLEAYYQESGRAGRDGSPADCILFYAPKDVPRMIEMIHGDNGEDSFWSMVKYANTSGNDEICKSLILNNLGEPNVADIEDVITKYGDETTVSREVGRHAQTVVQLLQYKISHGEKATLSQLVKEWRSKPENAPDCVRNNPPGKEFNVEECERIVVSLLLGEILLPKVSYTAYGANMYLKLGKTGFERHPNPNVHMRLPIRREKATNTKRASNAKETTKSKAPTTDGEGWITTNATATKKGKQPTKRKRSTSASSKRAKSKPRKSSSSTSSKTARGSKSRKTSSSSAKTVRGAKSRKVSKQTSKKKTAKKSDVTKSQASEVIELDMSSTESEIDDDEGDKLAAKGKGGTARKQRKTSLPPRAASTAKTRGRRKLPDSWKLENDDDDNEEDDDLSSFGDESVEYEFDPQNS